MRVELQAIIGGLPVGPEEFRAASKGNLICQKEVLPHLLTCASAAGWGRGGGALSFHDAFQAGNLTVIVESGCEGMSLLETLSDSKTRTRPPRHLPCHLAGQPQGGSNLFAQTDLVLFTAMTLRRKTERFGLIPQRK